ncbi:6300_t:CDS:10 [Funneliformis geosporum]|uniref:6300_t:CDS:1 n=1 Tax=Funneliformis geosporum TaxID=1117311 RepID=A0A9W4WUN3_9GLOM|nr:6300_t:CDS:10 [Funneliformis geosporum]
MYNIDHYFDFDSPPKSVIKSKKKKQQHQQMLLLLLLAVAGAYYFMIYLPEEERKKLETEIQKELDEVKNDPTRGTIEKDNNALFYGKTGTGKSATLKKLCVEVNKCPLVTVKGSSLTPTKQDYDASFGPLQKFIYTITDQTSNNILLHDPNKLRYLKDCLEGGKTNIDEAAYRKGRLSNPLDFNNKLINKFNIDNFVEDFLGYDPKQPNEEGKETNELERIDEREIEVGEFFQFFWQKQESSELDAYKDGKFESPRIPETSEVLADNLPNLAEIARLTSLSSNALSQSLENIAAEIENIGNNLVDYAQNSSITDDIRELPTIIATTAVAIATGGTSLAVQAAAIGGAYLLGEISKQIKEEIGNLQNERSNEASQLNTLDQQISQKQSKLNDPNVSETEKTQIRSELASLVSQRSSSQTRIKGLDEKIESLIKQGNKTVTGGGELREELGEKNVKEHLTATDCQRIFALKSKITQILTEKGIENYNTDSQKFLKRLQHWHISNINKRIRENGISTTKFVNNPNYSKLLSNNFTNQEEVKQVYKQSQQSQLLSEIMQLEQNPTNSNSQELDSKKQQLKDLETQSKELIKFLPIETQITILQKEIQVLTSKSTKTKAEQTILESKKQELAELLKKQSNSHVNNAKPTDKTALIVGGGIFIIFTLLLILILARNHQKKEITNLEELRLGNYDYSCYDDDSESERVKQRISQGIYNKFTGSLDYLSNMKKLKELNVSNIDVNEVDLDKLPDSLEKIFYSTKERPIRLKDIHRQNLVHKDFHSGNILYPPCRITDLGLSKPVGEEKRGEKVFGVVPYVAPEVLQEKPYTKAADIYSFGMISYEVLTGLTPYHGSAHDIDDNPLNRPKADEISKIFDKWHKEIKDEKSEFTQQVQEAEKSNQKLLEEVRFPSNKLHAGAFLTSKPINTGQISKLLFASKDIDLDLEMIEEFDIKDNEQDEQDEQIAQQAIPPK